MDLSVLTFDFIHMVTGSKRNRGTVGRCEFPLPTRRDIWGCYFEVFKWRVEDCFCFVVFFFGGGGGYGVHHNYLVT